MGCRGTAWQLPNEAAMAEELPHAGCMDCIKADPSVQAPFSCHSLTLDNHTKHKVGKSSLLAPLNKLTNTAAFKPFAFGDSTSIFGVGQGARDVFIKRSKVIYLP